LKTKWRHVRAEPDVLKFGSECVDEEVEVVGQFRIFVVAAASLEVARLAVDLPLHHQHQIRLHQRFVSRLLQHVLRGNGTIVTEASTINGKVTLPHACSGASSREKLYGVRPRSEGLEMCLRGVHIGYGWMYEFSKWD